MTNQPHLRHRMTRATSTNTNSAQENRTFSSIMSPRPHPPTRVLCCMSVPFTALVTAALASAKSKIDHQTFNHVVRSWLFGSYIASQISDFRAQRYRCGTPCCGAISHDLGWSTINDGIVSRDKCFEVDGADACRSFIISKTEKDREKWNTHRLQLAWDACDMSVLLVLLTIELVITESPACAWVDSIH